MQQEQAHLHSCIICETTKREGMFICSQFICVDCEAEMVNTDVQDVKYPFFIRQMKQVWLKLNA